MLAARETENGLNAKVVAVVQARMGSTRLPGKVLRPIGGRPVLSWMIDRLRAAIQLDELVVATTYLPIDQPIRALCDQLGVASVAGHPTDLLDRHLKVGRARQADAVVKIPSDCPLIDPRVVDMVVAEFRRTYPDDAYVGNLHPATWPDGNDVEVIRFDALEEAWCLATRAFQREHTTPFIWDQPDRFRLRNLVWPSGRDLSATHRLTLDYEEDLTLIAEVFQALHRPDRFPFSVEEIVALLDARPELRALNAAHHGSSWMSRHIDELQTLRPVAGARAEARQ
ncbi:MAG TPA: glycosyltransferase family protein [Polyangia bacterium]|nr:glycosyltransferase family protein [Polyangia bacterium]